MYTAFQFRVVQGRGDKKSPRGVCCPMHLRRICGTCAAFPAAAEIRAPDQYCSAKQESVNGSSCAADCPLWARKSVAPVKKISKAKKEV